MKKVFKFNKDTLKFEQTSGETYQTNAHFIQTDEIEPQKSHADFNSPVFTSRAKKRAFERARGFIEAGPGYDPRENKEAEPSTFQQEREAHAEYEAIKKDMYDVAYGRVQFSEKEKANHERERIRWGKNYKLKLPT